MYYKHRSALQTTQTVILQNHELIRFWNYDLSFADLVRHGPMWFDAVISHIPLSTCDKARKAFQIGTVRYHWPMSAHASQAFSIASCTDSEDLPKAITVVLLQTLKTHPTDVGLNQRCRLIMHRRYRPIGPQKYYLLTNATNFASPHLFTDMAVYATVIELCQ